MASFIENVNTLAGNIEEILLANELFDESVIPVLTEVAELDLQEVTADLIKGEYYGNRKLDIDLALNLYGLEDKVKTLSTTALATFISEGLGKINYTSASILFSDGQTIELPFLGASGNPTTATSIPMVKECLERKVVQAAQKQKDRITISLTDVLNNTAYRVEIDNIDYVYTTSANATRQELALGLTSAINNNDTNRITAVFNSLYPDYLEIVANTAGIPFTLTVDDNLGVQNIQPNLDNDYIDNAFIARLVRDDDTEATLASAVYGATNVPVLRYFDLIGASSGLERITLNVDKSTSSGYDNPNPAFYWGKTTSALRTLAMRAGDVIKLGNEIDNLILLSASIEEVIEIQARIPQLVDTYTTADDGSVIANGDLTIYNRLAELTAIHASLVKLAAIYDDIKTGGTNYINSVGADIQNPNSKINAVAIDLQKGDTSSIATLYTHIQELLSIYVNINNGNIGKLITNIDNNSILKLIQNIDNNNVSKIVGSIDNSDIPDIAASITDGKLPLVANNISAVTNLATNMAMLQTINTNLPEILLADDSAAASAAAASTAGAHALTAKTYAESMRALTARATTLTAGSPADVTYDSVLNKLVLGIPQGPKGDRGEAFNVTAVGTLANRAAYDNQVANFSYLATDTGELYIKNSATHADWSPAIPFGRGDTGATGTSIVDTIFVGTTDPSGLPNRLNAVDTYKITKTDGSFSTFTVANGYGQTFTVVTADYEADTGDYLLCDSAPTTKRDVLTDIVVTQGGSYEVMIDGESALYVADSLSSQTTNLQNIAVENSATYTVKINGEAASYTSDPLVAQVSTVSITDVADATEYTLDLDGVGVNYTSDAAVKQKNTINGITVANGSLYQLNINSNLVGYVSDAATAHVMKISAIIPEDSTLYAVVIDGTEVSYTSGVGATQSSIRDGLIAAINSNPTIGSVVTATDSSFDIVVTADVVGIPFSMVLSSGDMTITTTVAAGYATLSEITNGLVSAINDEALINGDVVAVVIASGVFTVESKVAGQAFTLSVTAGTISNAVTTPNNNATLTEIALGIKNAINASAAPITANVVANKVVLTAAEGGVPFTLTPGTRLTSVTDVVANKATLSEITLGLTAAINALSQPVTATNKTTYVAIAADTHEGTFSTVVTSGVITVNTTIAQEATLSEVTAGILAAIIALNNNKIAVNVVDGDIVVTATTTGVGYTMSLVQGTMTLVNTVASQPGVRNITLPSSATNGASITIFDATGSFSGHPVTIKRNGNLIMGLDEDMVVDVDQVKLELIYVNNDWRFE